MPKIVKWRLSAWPPGPRFSRNDKGVTVSNVAFRRDYAKPSSANRAAGQVHHRFPDAQIELTMFTYKGSFWVAEADSTEALYWCPTCGARLTDWSTADMTCCTSCGDEWDEETLKAS